MNVAIHRQYVTLSEADRDLLLRRLQYALDRFSDRILRVEVFVSDQNGPRGGVDKRCHSIVYLQGCRPVFASAEGADLEPLFSQMADRLGKGVRRELGRQRDSQHQRTHHHHN